MQSEIFQAVICYNFDDYSHPCDNVKVYMLYKQSKNKPINPSGDDQASPHNLNKIK